MAKAADSDVIDERRLRALTERLSKEHGIADRRELLQTIQVAITVYFTTLKASSSRGAVVHKNSTELSDAISLTCVPSGLFNSQSSPMLMVG